MLTRIQGIYSAMVQEARKKKAGCHIVTVSPVHLCAGGLEVQICRISTEGEVLSREWLKASVELTAEEQAVFTGGNSYAAESIMTNWRGTLTKSFCKVAKDGGIITGTCAATVVEALTALKQREQQELISLRNLLLPEINYPLHQFAIHVFIVPATLNEIYKTKPEYLGGKTLNTRAEAQALGQPAQHFYYEISIESQDGVYKIKIPFSYVDTFKPGQGEQLTKDIELYAEVLWWLFVLSTLKTPFMLPGGKVFTPALTGEDWRDKLERDTIQHILKRDKAHMKDGRVVERQQKAAPTVAKYKGVIAPLHVKDLHVFKLNLGEWVVYMTVLSVMIVSPYGSLVTRYETYGEHTYQEIEKVAAQLKAPPLLEFLRASQLNRK